MIEPGGEGAEIQARVHEALGGNALSLPHVKFIYPTAPMRSVFFSKTLFL